MPLALRAQLRTAQRHARPGVQIGRAVFARVVAGGGEIELHVRGFQLRPCLHVAAGMAGAGGEQALAADRVAQHLCHQPQPVRALVQRSRALHQRGNPRRVVIAQILPHAGQGMHHRHADLGQPRRVPHAGDLQQLRRVDAAAAQYHVAPRADGDRRAAVGAIGHAHRAPALEHDALGQGALDQVQIGPLQRRAQIRVHRAPAPPVLHHLLIQEGAFLVAGIVVGRAVQPQRLVGGDIRVRQRVRVALVLDVQRAAVAAHRGIAAAVAARLRALEIRQHVIPRPAAAAELPPHVVVGGLSPHIQMPVDRARPAQHFAARKRDPAPIDMRAGRGLVAPVQVGIVDRLVEAGRDLDEDVVVLAACFQHGHAVFARCAQPVRQHAPGGAGANNDIVELVHPDPALICHMRVIYR